MISRSLALPVLAAALLLSCAPGPSGERGSEPGGSGTSPTKILRIAFQGYHEPSSGVTNYGTISAAGSTNLEHFLIFHAALTVTDEQSSVQPRLAEKVPSLQDGDWVLLPDGRMDVTWRLRPGLTWHDGTPVNADHFAFGLRVATDPELPITMSAWWKLVSEVEVRDPRTLVFHWKTPSILGNSNASDGIPALPRHLLADLYQGGDKTTFANSPFWTTGWVGLGPYRLGQWQLGSFIEGLAFDGYALGRPKIDRIILHYAGDVDTLIAGLLSGDFDVAPYGALLDADQVATLQTAWGVGNGSTAVIDKGVRAFWLQFRDANAPWVRDARVREALVHALDRRTLSDTLQNGLSEAVDIVLWPDDPAYRLVQQQGFPRYPFDPTRAQQLLAEAGWTIGTDRGARDGSGQPLTLEMRATAQGDNVKEMEAVAGEFAAIGVQPVLAPIPPQADNKDELKNTMAGGLFWPYNFSATHPQALISAQVATPAGRWKGSNYGGYSNGAYDRLYEQFETTLNSGQRQQIVAQIVQLIAQQIPIIPIYYNIQAASARQGIVGMGKASPLQAASAWNIHAWDIRS